MADGLFGRRHLQLGSAQAVGGVPGLLVQILAGDAEDDVILTDGAALLDAEFRHSAGGSCHNGLLALVSKVCGVEGADAVHLCHSGLCGGQAACVGNSDGDSAGHQTGVAGRVCTRNGADGAVQRLKGGVRHDLCGLTCDKALGLCGREIHGQQHHRGVADGGHSLTSLHGVACGDCKGADLAADLGADILHIRNVIVIALCLLHRELCAREVVFHIRNVDGVKNIALFDAVAQLKVGGEHRAGDEGLDGVGIGGVDGAAAVVDVHDVAASQLLLRVGKVCRRAAALARHDDRHQHCCGCDHRDAALFVGLDKVEHLIFSAGILLRRGVLCLLVET